jgi:hypothetical protein
MLSRFRNEDCEGGWLKLATSFSIFFSFGGGGDFFNLTPLPSF